MRKTEIFCRGKCLLMLPFLLLGGCTKVTPGVSQNGYYTEFAMTATEYSLYISQQVGVITNQLTTRMSTAKAVSEGTYGLDREIGNTEETIQKLSEIENDVTAIMPAQTYETDRQNLLDSISDVKGIMNTYLGHLQSGATGEISGDIEAMRSCFYALTGMGNTAYS